MEERTTVCIALLIKTLQSVADDIDAERRYDIHFSVVDASMATRNIEHHLGDGVKRCFIMFSPLAFDRAWIGMEDVLM